MPRRLLLLTLLLALLIAPGALIADIDSSERVPYFSSSSESVILNRFSGRYVALFLPDDWIGAGGLSTDERRQLIDRLDWFYDLYRSIVGGEPLGEGLLPMYVVPIHTPGVGGLGALGRKWVEISTLNLASTKNNLRSAGFPDEVFIHEMAHNFDLFGDYLGYGLDWPHTWTGMLITAAETYGGSGRSPVYVAAWAEETWRRTYHDYLDEPGATWTKCVRTGSGCVTPGAGAWIGVTTRAFDLHGIDALPRFIAAVKTLGPQRFHGTPEEKEDLHIEALAAAVQLDLGCYGDYLRWQVSPALRDRMRTAYGPNPFCEDRDGDGYSPLAGDTDDGNSAVHPGAVEVINGVDDDSDGTADNTLYAESEGGDFPATLLVHYPARVVGAVSMTDADEIEFELPAAGEVRVDLRPLSAFPFLTEITDRAGTVVATIPPIFDALVPLGAGKWRVRIGAITFPPLPGEIGPGRYELNLRPPATRGWKWGVVATPIPSGQTIRFTAITQTLSGALRQPTEVRFWVSTIGFVGSVPYSPVATFEWTVPANLPKGPYAYRAQAFAGQTPATDVTPPLWFSIPPAPRRHAAGR